ncbi:GntR family transcriptional regulator [Marinobacterium halophilum]|uniref:GntR family transcriptional regulator n=1 Tax=Marinobacterium halophilum TaxID=267374 RepID=A0A2P8EZT3_9GAMM|nr:S1-like domain-containing RNA-binding protein [Marinobacterium halophilum]PSL14973.1 GntR family transcriptional regulator [Marinobacterium halophilum]
MAETGQFNKLKVIREVEFGVYLEGGRDGGILLPKSEVPEGTRLGDSLQVFVYLDSNDMPIATTRRPRAQVGQFASLKVVDVNQIGAFLDWGLPKDLFLPFNEQLKPLTVGDYVTVFLYLDNTDRIAATAKLEKHLESGEDYPQGQLIELLVVRPTDIGYQVIIDNRAMGLLHTQDIHRPVRSGQRMPGFIKQVREEDGKVDVMLEKPGYARIDPLAQQVLKYLETRNGFCPLGDKSDPAAISETFGVSKKAYKMAIGQLMKAGRISQDERGIHLKG